MGFAFAFLFYIAALTFGITLASSVVEEKQSRIVEIIATAIPVRQLLAGKIARQHVRWRSGRWRCLRRGRAWSASRFTDYAASCRGRQRAGRAGSSCSSSSGSWPLACLWAVAGALASRTEDVQIDRDPADDAHHGDVLRRPVPRRDRTGRRSSYVPPFSAMLMPMRVLEGTAPWWEAVVALASCCSRRPRLVVRVAERLYRRSLLQTRRQALAATGLVGPGVTWSPRRRRVMRLGRRVGPDGFRRSWDRIQRGG